ncbi:hypothetical protein GQ44DRAFT_623585 [Phaeosphaeriaceae sp. PMI808]|nr:hypothetical protein GQ44DRAFT_623585 [Phaeosphaeriaceae sp. PMI808]
MSASKQFSQLLRAPPFCRTALLPPIRPQTLTYALLAPLLHHRCISLPTILQPSFWGSMVPKPLRSRSDQPRSREWNPATPYIILGLLVGSQAIQILWLKQERGHSLRKAEAKIGLLKEVIERVQRGEDVPVESILGTGNAESEKEWTELLKNIENEDVLFQSKKKRRALRQAAEQEAAETLGKEQSEDTKTDQSKVQVESVGGVRFY